MSLSVVHSYAVSGTGSAALTATITAPAPGNALLVFGGRPAGTESFAMVSIAGGGVTWGVSADVAVLSGSGVAECWSGLNSSGSGTSLTITFGTAYGLHEAFIIEVAGLVTSGTKTDGTGSAYQVGGGTTSRPSCTTSFMPSAGVDIIILAGWESTGSGQFASAPSGFTAIGTGTQGQAYYKIIAGPSGSYNPTVTVSSNYTFEIAAAAAYKSAGAPPPSVGEALFFL